MLNEELIKKWSDGTIGPDDIKSPEQKEEYEALLRLDESLQAFKAPDFNIEEALREVNGKKTPKARVVRMTGLGNLLKVAAVVLLVLLGYFILQNSNEQTISTQLAQKTTINLPDQTEVQINAASSLAYNKRDWQENRLVSLEGEAFFKVTKGSKFDVETARGIVTVLGTQFNVKVRNTLFEVNCFEGKVAVITEDDTVNLTINQGIRIFNDQVIHLNPIGSAPSWVFNESSFESIPFGEVISELERQYAIKVETEDVNLAKNFTGSFPHDDLETALKSIALPFNLKIEQTANNNIVLSADKK